MCQSAAVGGGEIYIFIFLSPPFFPKEMFRLLSLLPLRGKYNRINPLASNILHNKLNSFFICAQFSNDITQAENFVFILQPLSFRDSSILPRNRFSLLKDYNRRKSLTQRFSLSSCNPLSFVAAKLQSFHERFGFEGRLVTNIRGQYHLDCEKLLRYHEQELLKM